MQNMLGVLDLFECFISSNVSDNILKLINEVFTTVKGA